MRLNIGCGKKYESGCVNVDLYESLVADYIMPVTDLTFEDNTAEEIKAIQVIEHLNFFESIYALSEFYRVLKSGGKLIIETPDLKKACEIYINSTNEQKKEILGWFYGIPHKGLQHKLCFPPFLLIELLENVGFENITLDNFYNEEAIPTIRFKCKKEQKSHEVEIFQTLSNLRKCLISQNKIDFSNSYLCKEQEDLITYIGVKLLEIKEKRKKELLYNLIEDLLIKWPDLVNNLISVVKGEDLFSEVELESIRDGISFLIDHKFVDLLYCSIKKGPINPGTQKIVIYSTELFARNLIKNQLFLKEKRATIEEKIRNISQECAESDNVIFSERLIEKKALDLYYLGIKAFHKESYKQSHNLFLKAIKFNRDNYNFFWYLGKTLVKLESFNQAEKIYKKTLRLIKITKIKNKKDLKSQIENELNWIKKRKDAKSALDPIKKQEKI